MEKRNPVLFEKRICLREDLYYQPLIYGLVHKKFKDHFIKSFGREGQAANKLKEGEVDLSIISPIDYAQNRESWRIIPRIAAASKGGSNSILLFFRKGLKEIKTVAVDQYTTGANVLLKILLQEKFALTPEYLHSKADLDVMLSRADAALLTGNKALIERRINRLDLCEEWSDLTGLPYIHGFWAGRDIAIKKEDITIVMKSFDLGMKNLTAIAKHFADTYHDNWAYIHDILTKNVYYRFEEEEKEGLREFFNYTFFYGYSEFIPELLFFEI
jgi:chorismate dehydratase